MTDVWDVQRHVSSRENFASEKVQARMPGLGVESQKPVQAKTVQSVPVIARERYACLPT
jgi:hypothetical protein